MTERARNYDFNPESDVSELDAVQQAEAIFAKLTSTQIQPEQQELSVHDQWRQAKIESRQKNPPPARSSEHNYAGSNRQVIIDPVTGAWLRDY